MKDTWFSPGEVKFTIRQTLWLIQNLASLESGHWPPEASNYVDTGGKSGRHKAPFITSAEYYAEVTDRLEKTGIDGLILEAMESWGKSVESMSKYFRMPEFSIAKRRKQALGYIASGPGRRWHTTKKREGETYQDFKQRKAKPKYTTQAQSGN